MSAIIKICGLSTASTLEAALDAGADVVGFVFFEKSPRHLSLEQAGELAERARGRAQIAALTVDASDAALDAIVAAIAPDHLQLHGRETPARVADLRRMFGLSTIKAIGVSGADDLAMVNDYAESADRLLFDAKAPKDARLPGGNGVVFDWRLLARLDIRRPWLLSGGLDPENVAQAIAITGARGVDVSSGVESAPGRKDVEKIRTFIAKARAAFSQASIVSRMDAGARAQAGRVA